MEIMGLSTDLAMATNFKNRYRSLILTLDSNTLMGNDRAALTDMIRSSSAPSASSSSVHLAPNTFCGYAASVKPSTSSTRPSTV